MIRLSVESQTEVCATPAESEVRGTITTSNKLTY
jgi:hypothetical protein